MTDISYSQNFLKAIQDPTGFSLGNAVFKNPETGLWELALDIHTYISGQLIGVYFDYACPASMLIRTTGMLKWPEHSMDTHTKYYIHPTVAGTFTSQKPTDDSRHLIIPIDSDTVMVGYP